MAAPPKKATAVKSAAPKAKATAKPTKQKSSARAVGADAAAQNKKRQPPPVVIGRTTGAVAALEAGIRLMFSEEYDKAIKAFKKVLVDFPEEAEIQASVRGRIQACEKKLLERGRSVFRSADDHYNVAVAFLNGGNIDQAITHLQSALKIAPKSDHILYAMAAAQALKGEQEPALSFLKQAIASRPENRFQAASDPDFASLSEEQAFKELVTSSDK